MRNRPLIRIVVPGLLFFVLSAEAVLAQDPVHKAGRGIVNVITGWLEIPKQIHVGSREANSVTGMSRGLLRGFSLTFLRMGVGVFEAVTFPFEYPAKYASPYESMERPDYAWE